MTLTRRSCAAALFVIASWLLLVSTDESVAGDKKISGAGQATSVLSESRMLPGDDPRHEVVLIRRIDADKGTLGDGQVSVVNVADEVAGSGTHGGYRVSTFGNGDKAFSAYKERHTAVTKAGGPPEMTFEGKWWFKGGTGRWNGITLL